jgi:hypothetical protein
MESCRNGLNDTMTLPCGSSRRTNSSRTESSSSEPRDELQTTPNAGCLPDSQEFTDILLRLAIQILHFTATTRRKRTSNEKTLTYRS